MLTGKDKQRLRKGFVSDVFNGKIEVSHAAMRSHFQSYDRTICYNAEDVSENTEVYVDNAIWKFYKNSNLWKRVKFLSEEERIELERRLYFEKSKSRWKVGTPFNVSSN